MATKSATLRMPQRRLYSPSIRRRKTKRILSAQPGISLKAVAAVLVLCLFLGLSFVTSYKIQTVAQDMKLLEQRYSNLLQENASLSKEFSAMASHERLVRLGKRLGLHKPSEDQIITLR